MTHEVTLGAMNALAERICRIMLDSKTYQNVWYPMDLQVLVEPECLRAAAELSVQLPLTHPIRSCARWQGERV